MNKNFKNFILLFSFAFLFMNMVISQSHAKAMNSDLTITYPGMPGPLFSLSNIKPLDSFSETVSVTNNSSSDQMFTFRISSVVGNTPLADVLILQIKRGSDLLLSDTISNLKNPDERNVGIVKAGATDNFDFIVTMPNVGNDFMGLKITTADFVISFNQQGQVLGIKTEEISGTKLPATGGDLTLLIIYSIIIASLVLILSDRNQRKRFIQSFKKASRSTK